MKPPLRSAARVLAIPLMLCACDLDSQVAPRVELDVVVDSAGMVTFENAEGYTIEITRMRVAFENVEFTSGGEMHMAFLHPLHDLLVPTAYAHPGHYAGGEIVGEMNGRFVVDWLADGESLGTATLLGADYRGANFVFTRAQLDDGVTPEDPILGHTFDIAGRATKDGMTWTFSAALDEDDGRRVVGLPFDVEIDASSDEVLGLQMLPVDPYEGDTAFDELDFAALDEDGDFVVELRDGDADYNILKKHLQVHDHYAVTIE